MYRYRRLCLALVMVLLTLTILASPASAEGVTRISGVGYFASASECPGSEHVPTDFDFALNMTGDLEGCLYVFVETAECRPSGAYLERGTEIYVGGGAEGDDGTFTTTYRFEAKYDDCANLMGEIHGRCQHRIVESSGTEDYEGVTGRFDIKDDIEAGNFPYRGHLRWDGASGAG